MTTPPTSADGPITAEDELLGLSIVRQAGELIRSSIAAGGYSTEWKADNTPVTSIDKAVNRLGITMVHQRFPHDRVLGEEESFEAGTPSGMTWVLDPIDGTQVLTQQIPAFTCCLARVDPKGNPLWGMIYNPSFDELLFARRGGITTLNGARIAVSKKSRIKSSAVYLGSRLHGDVTTNGVVYDRIEGQGGKVYNLRALAFSCTQVARGLAEGAFIGVTTPFEAASVQLIVEGAGGKVTDLYGNPPGRMDRTIRGLVVSNGLLHGALLAALQPAAAVPGS